MPQLAPTSAGLLDNTPGREVWVATYTGTDDWGRPVTAVEIRLQTFPDVMFVAIFHAVQWNRLRIGPHVALSGGIYGAI